jgi:intein/homing endonuclease
MRKIKFDKCIVGTGKAGMDFSSKLAQKYNLPTEQKSVQIGCRFEAPQKYFQKLIDISYDFKLYKKFDNVSLRSFCLPGTETIHIERDGIKIFVNINEVLNTDKILTYDFDNQVAKFINPKTLFNREYKGNLITINNKLTTTEDHIYFVWGKEKVEDKYDTKNDYKYDAFELNKIIEKQAKDLIIGDKLVIPRKFPKLNQLKGTSYTNEQLWMFGLWFADDKSKWDSDEFSLTNEDYILNKIIEILEKQKESFSSKEQYDNYSILNFSSKILKEFLINENCFKKGKERGLPNSIFSWSEEEIYSFLSGLIDGNVKVKKEHNISLDYFTVSDLLYRDLTYLLNYLNISYKGRIRKTSTNFKGDSQINIINITQRDSMLLLSKKLNLQNINKNKLLQENINIEFKERDNKNYENIYSIESKYYEGLVYDFEIENTHNFIVGKTPIIIHNCTNNNAAYVAVEETYGDITYNGHAKKDEKYRNNMTNFGILMEIKGIENPFEWSRDAVKKLQINGTGTYYSPNRTRTPTLTSEGNTVSAIQVDSMDILSYALGEEYSQHIKDFIIELQNIFPEMGDDWGIYMPEVKYTSPEPITNHNDLSLINYSNIYFAGDSLSARGITVAGSQGILCSEGILKS